MRVLGIDCGGEYTGYGVVEQDEQGGLHHLCSGAIRLLPREALELRLMKICQGLTEVIAAYSPEVVTIEDVFYAVNAKSALKLGTRARRSDADRSAGGTLRDRLLAAVHQIGGGGIRPGGEVAGAVDGRAPAGSARTSGAAGRC